MKTKFRFLTIFFLLMTIIGTGVWLTTCDTKSNPTSNLNQVVTPIFSIGGNAVTGGTYAPGQSVTITTTTAGATIRYTVDGSTPTSSVGTVYSTAISISTTTTVKAIAYLSGMTDSQVASATFTINTPANQVEAPTFNPPAGTYSSTQNVTLSTNTSGATIRYTTDGTSPSSSVGTVYSTAIPVSITTTLKAIAYKTGMTDSTEVTAIYTLNLTPVATPTFSPSGGMQALAQLVTITTTTAGATIRYTTDGTTPSSISGSVYSTAIPISSTLKAIAYKTGFSDSPVATATYTVVGCLVDADCPAGKTCDQTSHTCTP